MSSGIQQIFAAPKAALYNAKTKIGSSKSLNSSQIESLQKENARLTQKLIDYEKLKTDNDALRNQFEDGSTHNYKMIPSRVIGFIGKFAQPSALIIDQGEKSGVKSGMAVVSGNNLVGKIDKVFGNYSKVLLPTDISFSTIVTTAENGSLGIVTGQQDFILLDHVSIKDKITRGETILTNGGADNSNFGIPKELIIGKIESVYRNESEPFQTAKVGSQVNTEALNMVFVVLGF